MWRGPVAEGLDGLGLTAQRQRDGRSRREHSEK